MTKGNFFDQISLASIANLTAGMTSTRGTFIELISSFIIVRIALKIFYKTSLTLNAELQLFIVSSISWIIGNSLLRDHEWQTPDLYLEPDLYKNSTSPKEGLDGMAFVTRICLDLLRKVV
jgi:hypothetical protein